MQHYMSVVGESLSIQLPLGWTRMARMSPAVKKFPVMPVCIPTPREDTPATTGTL